jgi:hypothetical protein
MWTVLQIDIKLTVIFFFANNTAVLKTDPIKSK